MLTQVEQRKAAKDFAKKWEGKGYEKGESAKFWLSLLHEVYGIKYPAEFISFEDQVKLDNTSFIDGYIPLTNVLIEQKSLTKDLRKPIRQSDGTLLSPFQQAKRYSAELPYSERPRWIVTCNFKEFHIYDMEKPSGEPEVVLLSELENDYYRMYFLVDKGDENIQKEKEVSLKAGELVGVLYDALLKEYHNPEDEQTLKDLNILCVRLVFCFYAEDAGIFGRHSLFHDYLIKYKDVNFRDALIKVFQVLDQKPEERDPYLEDDLAAFPYVNGELFENEEVVIPRINDEIIDIILNQASANFDWSNISPTIFGGVFESTLNPETRRSGGMHYTSIENIHKVIDPLFMNELNEEFEEIKNIKIERTRNRKLEAFQEKIASLKFLDPAAGSGNFLTETYLSLRRLENKIIKLRYGNQIIMGEAFNPIKVSIGQFYGIEINDFAVTVARTALWIAESQMLIETEDIIHINLDFLPLKSYANIVEENALRFDWEELVSKDEINYIMGNPPFIGARYMDKNQAKELKEVFGKKSGIGKLDYVTGWYKKAGDFVDGTNIECAFVSTNSITQGEQVSVIWNILFNENKIIINFAYQTFKWSSEAKNKAAVHCVIIGFSQIERTNKFLYISNSQVKKVQNINGYALEAPNISIEGRSVPLCDVPILQTGTRIGAQEYVFKEKEMLDFIKEEPLSAKYFHEYLGGAEFLNNKKRYCLYLENCSISDLRRMPKSMEIIKNVSESRIKKKHKLKDYPKQYVKLSIPKSDYLFIPQVSSERRKYIPIDFVSKDVWAADPHFMLENADLYLFGVLTSNVHNAWMRAVAGRLEMRYRYSNRIVYNTFLWVNPTKVQKARIESTAEIILNVRRDHKGASLADLYDEVLMPSELRRAHQENDKAVMEAYGFDWRNMTESECVAELMKMYQDLTK